VVRLVAAPASIEVMPATIGKVAGALGHTMVFIDTVPNSRLVSLKRDGHLQHTGLAFAYPVRLVLNH
jgi:hypothetical protein